MVEVKGSPQGSTLTALVQNGPTHATTAVPPMVPTRVDAGRQPGSTTGGRIRTAALAAALPVLWCPVCRCGFRLDDRRLLCERGHSFDIARQGYVNLVVGHRQRASADPPDAVAARARFLAAGYYTGIAETIRRAAAGAAPATPGVVIDLAGGTGYYLARLLDALPHHIGVCIDLSAAALRRAARAHPRAAAVGADVWGALPLRDGCASVVTSVFGPRNPKEIHRVLAPDGVLVVATPTPAHLRELVEPIGMLTIEPDKQARLDRGLRELDHVTGQVVDYSVALDHAAVTDLVTMGPTGRHVLPEVLAERLRRLPEPVAVTVSVRVGVYRSASPDRHREVRTERDGPAERVAR